MLNLRNLAASIRRLGGDSPTAFRHGNDATRRSNPRAWHIDYLLLRRLLRAVERAAAELDRGTVLDVGCGEMPYAPFVTARYVGLDISRGSGVVVIGDAHRIPVVSGACDAVVSFQALEHVEEPAVVVAEIGRVLRPGGRIVVTTHGTWPYHGHDFHRWTGQGLEALFAGFDAVRVTPLGGPCAVTVAVWNQLLRDAARATPRGPVRVGARVLAAVAALAANAAGLAFESLASRATFYRNASWAFTDVYIVTGVKPAPPHTADVARADHGAASLS
jgi:SAM-dependent methyltransferase